MAGNGDGLKGRRDDKTSEVSLPRQGENQERRLQMRKVLLIASVVGLAFAPASFGASSVVGEKLDNGLGALPASYTAAEFQKVVLGESLDSGLGALPASYTAAEFQKVVLGESLDSGLGALPASYTAAEFQKVVLGESLDSGLGALPSSYTAAEFQKQLVATR
jgi:hypothetical protein